MKLKSIRKSDKVRLFGYFLILIFSGTLLLSLPIAWGGTERLKTIDCLFTATSAVCVTGLITVDTAKYTLLGKITILLLIQAGGLGIISFSTIYIILPRKRISLTNRKAITAFSLDSIEYEPKTIVGKIILFTFGVELMGAALLYLFFFLSGKQFPVFISIFHSVSAFCNAGFSLFTDNFEGFIANPGICIVLSLLIILGGLGFIVLLDVERTVLKKKRRISYHSKIVLLVTVSLITASTLFFLLFESNHSLRGLPLGQKFLASYFQAVTPRTAGFNTIPQTNLSFPSKLFTLPLMFIGASPGSSAGGIKITTFFLVFLLVTRDRDSRDEMLLFKRKISPQTLSNALVFTIRAFLILFISIFLLVITEHLSQSESTNPFFPLLFESFSAFGTVGLSLNTTFHLSAAGKIVIILTMFAGRVGMISMAMGRAHSISPSHIDYPREEVLIG